MLRKMGYEVTEWKSRPKESSWTSVLGVFWGVLHVHVLVHVLVHVHVPWQPSSCGGYRHTLYTHLALGYILFVPVAFGAHLPSPEASAFLTRVVGWLAVWREQRPVPFDLVVGWLAVWREQRPVPL